MDREKSNVAGILLAAGESSRMGSPKQLLEAGGQFLLDRTLGEALKSRLDAVILVLGHEARKIRRALATDLDQAKLQVVVNRKYREGMSSSIRLGLSRAEETCDHVMIMLADMPYLTSGLIDRLITLYLSSGLPLGAVTVNNRRSHPVVIGRSLYQELHSLRGDKGARDLFFRHAEQVCSVVPDSDYDDGDIDTPEDFLKYKESLETST
jgi:molybdenum cofactor cytidylyltransferase